MDTDADKDDSDDDNKDKNGTIESSMSVTQKIVRLITIVMKDMSFDFDMPMVDLKVKGGVESMIIAPTSTSMTPYNLKATTSVRGYYLAIDDKESVDVNDFSVALNMTASGDEHYIKQLYAKRERRGSNDNDNNNNNNNNNTNHNENNINTSDTLPLSPSSSSSSRPSFHSSGKKRGSSIYHKIPENILDTPETIRIEIEILILIL